MSTNIKFSGRDITIKTLTVREVKNFVEEFTQNATEGGELHLLDLLFDDDVPALAVSMATGLSFKELSGDIKPAEVRELWDAVRAENPFFVGMMERMVAAGKQMQKTSPEQSAA